MSSSPAAASSRVEAVVIGAGVVGLAVTRALALLGKKEVLLLDRAGTIGSETSSRNSEVVHGGLYYPAGSNKARFCVTGRRMLYDFCESRLVPYHKLGKLVVATDERQRETLVALQKKAVQNGVLDTRLLSREDVRRMEPHVKSHGALWSPSTGIVDSHTFMMTLLGEAENCGSATLALHANVEAATIDQGNEGPTVQLCVDGMWLSCGVVINSAGLWADRLAAKMHSHHSWTPPRQYFSKGNYFHLRQDGKSPFTHLVYPVPDERGGLGVHATLDANGQVRFGPDVEWLDPDADPDAIDMKPDSGRARQFYESIRTYWPDLPNDALEPDYAGIRPKLMHPDHFGSSQMPFQDFQILGPADHGVPGLVHLLGIESPGLTSCMAIAEYVANMIEKA